MIQPGLPDFIDNENLKLAEALDMLLRRYRRADIASGYFNLGGFELVKDALFEAQGLRILLAKEGGGNVLYPPGFQKDLASARFEKRNRELAQQLATLLSRPEVEVRLYTKGLFHGKAYIFDEVAIIGSSNFTRAGLTGNTELNSVHKQKYAAEAARQWFERFWAEAEEYKEELIRLLQESKLISNGYSPFLVFLKSLYEYFKDELKTDLEQGRDIGRSLVDLTSFQQKAFERALRILEKYDGVFIADSVGLGKTWIGKKLLEHYGYFQRKRCLVIAPAQLKGMWEKELQAIQVAAWIVSMESMGRENFDPSPYFECEFVVVDESHNFRNFNQRYEALSRLMASGRRKKMVLLTATPINNSVFDLYNQIMLFTQGRERYFARAGIPHLRSYFIRALEDGDLLNLLEEIMVRRTRQFIKMEFPDAVIDGERIRFPERRLHTERYDLEVLCPRIYNRIARLFEELSLAVYNPEAFLREPTQEQQLERQRNEAIIGLIKILLLKRFESSVEAFRTSVRRQIEFHQRFIRELVENQRLLSSGDYRRLLALESEAEASSILQNLPAVEASAYRTVELAKAAAEDLERFREMARLVEPIRAGNDPKIAKLVELIRARPGKKIVVFSNFQDTVRYIDKALKEAYAKDLEGVRWEVVDGQVDSKQRAAILRRFTPRSQKVQIPPEEELDLLIATDIFSEGQNLQDADTLINFDLHWNPTRMIQRAGRIDRLGSPFEVIHIHNFYPEDGLEEILGLIKRLTEKIAQINRNVGLDASILGEAISPKTFNALRRIEQEDKTIADELEAEAEISSEFMRLALSRYLQKAGAERLEAIPFGVHSGKQGRPGGRKGIFFHFRVRGEHLWRFYDVETGEILDSKYRIYSLIECDEETPRVEANFDIDTILEKVRKELLEELNLQNAVSVEPMPKIQREVVSKLRGLAKHPAIARQDLISLLKVLNQPLNRVLLREIEDIYRKYGKDEPALFQALKDFSERYRLEDNLAEVQPGTPITEDELELVVYLTVS